MELTSTMTIRLPETIKIKLEHLAKATERSKAYLAAKAIEEFVDAQEWQIQAIQDAVREADSLQAKFIGHEAVGKRVKLKMDRSRGKRT